MRSHTHAPERSIERTSPSAFVVHVRVFSGPLVLTSGIGSHGNESHEHNSIAAPVRLDGFL